MNDDVLEVPYAVTEGHPNVSVAGFMGVAKIARAMHPVVGDSDVITVTFGFAGRNKADAEYALAEIVKALQ